MRTAFLATFTTTALISLGCANPEGLLNSKGACADETRCDFSTSAKVCTDPNFGIRTYQRTSGPFSTYSSEKADAEQFCRQMGYMDCRSDACFRAQ